jgi:hypothetical protein
VKKQLLLIESLIKGDLQVILDKWDKPTFIELLETIKRFVTVKRDREYYGTSTRRSDRINDFLDLDTYRADIHFGFKRFVTLNESGSGLNYNIEFTSKATVVQHMKIVDRTQYVLDQLVELVYREEFLDVVISFRDLRNDINELVETDFSTSELKLSELIQLSDEIFSRVQLLERRFSELPLPTRIFKRVEEAVTIREPQLVKR